ncbi:T9SS type A sorting domain-containing protein [candidate division WOR-3 bacterium]|nr:T9SS type A sorting domain-containing protein [candidate division WOR-3 bacterium]
MQRLLILVGLLVVAGFAFQTVAFESSWGEHPQFNIVSQTRSGMEIVFSLHEMLIEDMVLDNVPMQSYGLASVYIPQAGAPSLGGATRYVAIPQGARVEVVLLNSRTEVYQGIEVLPAPNIPFETDDAPLRYEKDMAIYGRDAYFPSSPVLVSAPMQIRGVDVVIINVTPYQYNPVRKELIVYQDLRFRLDYVGGNGRFGDDRLRSRFWEPVLQGHLLNYSMLPEIDFYAPERIQARDGWEYVIIVPDDPVFEAWGDTIKAWRKLQGISCEVFTLTEVGGNSVTAIRNFLSNAYNTWDPAPVAFLLLSDYPSSGDVYGITSPTYSYSYTCVTDNKYADVNGDSLPDMHHARICAQSETHLSTMINKFLSYERNPYTAANFYNEPLMACGWQTERWFQLAVEIIRGYFINVHGKNPARQYNIYSGTPYAGSPWSSNSNTYMIVAYFGAAGLGYIPDTNPYDAAWWNNGSSTGITNAINSGAFLLQHRDHGSVTGWGEPNYQSSHLSALTNEQYIFVYSTNCLTGKYNYATECFTERFHRIPYGALGLNSASETSYSFVNDTYIWGMYDCLWPDFMPGYPLMGPQIPTGHPNLMPCMAMSSGKYFLAQSSWPYNPVNKDETYHLFHHHGDAFNVLYSEVPQNLNVAHAPVLPSGTTTFAVSANDSSVIALTVNGEIIGVAEGTGSPVNITIPPQVPGTTVKVTVTKANYYRYEADVSVTTNTYPYVMLVSSIIDDQAGGNNDGIINPGETIDFGVWAKNVGAGTAQSVYGLLSSANSYLTMNTDSSWYGDINENDSALSNPYYNFTVAANCPNGEVINLDLEFHDIADSIFVSHPSVTVYAPILTYQTYTISGGNGNGILEPGETVDLTLALQNSGGAVAAAVAATIATADPYLTILTDTASYGDIPVDSMAQSLTPYVVQADSATPVPYVAQVVVSITGTGYVAVDTFGLLIGNIGFYDTVEDTAVTNQYTVQGQWHRTQHRSHSPTYAWWNGTEGTWQYSNNVDASIITPSITLGPNSQFECWNWYYLESGYDYGYIEISTNNGTSWNQLTSFNGNSGTWVQYSTALNYPIGTQVNIRFRLHTDYSVVYEGWYVDDIRVFDPTGVSEFSSLAASEVTALLGVYPNPFRHSSTMSYQLVQSTRVSLLVYDVSGRLVKSLTDGLQEPGYYTVTWPGRDDQGRKVPAGVYFIRFDTDDASQVEKTVLLR